MISLRITIHELYSEQDNCIIGSTAKFIFSYGNVIHEVSKSGKLIVTGGYSFNVSLPSHWKADEVEVLVETDGICNYSWEFVDD